MPTLAYLDALNPDQRRAVEHEVSPDSPSSPLLIIAGAGSGKTSTLAHRVAHLIVSGIDPDRILLMTFSRRAATEMSRRAGRIVAQATSPTASRALRWTGTFHAIGGRLLREYGRQVGLDPAFTIHDREDSADLMNMVRHDPGLATNQKRFPAKATCLAIYSRTVNEEAALDEILRDAFPWCADWEAELNQLYKGYVEAKQAQNILDFDDLLLYWAAVLEDGEVAAHIGARFDHILVDEYQDTNRLQATILQRLKPDGKGLAVVGDDAQSIYSFRAATVRNILDFPSQFSPPATVVTLSRNYRSSGKILAASNGVIGLAAERYTKDLWTDRKGGGLPSLVTVSDETDQANYVTEQVLAAREAGIALKAQAVLFRTSHHSGPLEVELNRRDIPFVKYGGLKFLDTAHVKDTLAILRFAENPRDRVSGFRVLQLLPGVGPSAAGAILATLALTHDVPAALAAFEPPERTADDWPGFVTLIGDLHATGDWPADIERVRLWYEPHLDRIHEDAVVRRNDLLQLEQIARAYPSRERFLTELTLDPPDATSDEAGPPLLDEDYLILSTIHSAKGQEWKSVYVLSVTDGCIPSDMSTTSAPQIEEERRLLYVAMTRAKDTLEMIVPQRFYASSQARNGDRHMYSRRTRFIPDAILDRFDARIWPAARQDGPVRVSQLPVASADIRGRMRARWG